MTDSQIEYQLRYGVQFIDELGDGKDGDVLETSRGYAVKFLHDEGVYNREVRAYEILGSLDIGDIDGFQIPRMRRHDDSLRAIEMTIVRPPFIIDFAAAYTEEEYEQFEFTEEVLEERENHWSEVFGDKWPAVRTLCQKFTGRTGLVLLDLSLNNIRFA